MKITIIGNGYVGKATKLALEQSNEPLGEIFIYDKVADKSECSLTEALSASLFFVCVPTPMKRDGSCDLSSVEEVMRTLSSNGTPSSKIIFRSTVPVGTCDRFKVNFIPEFLTEANWRKDVINSQDWIVGLSEGDYGLRTSLPKALKGKMHFCSTREAELAKYARNCFLATKVSFFNEIKAFCDAKQINYNHVKELTSLDSRINSSHTDVPGPDGKNGFGGTCFPKDIHSLSSQMEKVIIPHVIKAVIYRNEFTDRPEKDWERNEGRSVSS
jgi:UDPglucose 6-dehydrogenase